ncbi:MAG: A/G-specific adenine glycosylase [Anaerolineales bacterium]|nr:A/G-specific adenine glycosylase [Anaerolineales bacterium]
MPLPPGGAGRYNVPMTTSLAQKLLDWYEKHQRALPWRERPSPYATLISEYMLQQTRVETVIPYFERWMVRFPAFAALAAAEREEVLRLWEGLGYYRRAHNLHQAAQIVVEAYGGELPGDIQTLQGLPGIGRYTAAAIAAIGFNQPAVALDGNLRRVLARLMDLELPARSVEGERALLAFGQRNLPEGSSSSFNQSLMDLGSLVCIAKVPVCENCPLQSECLARAHGTIIERPVKMPRKPIPRVEAAAGVLKENGRVLIGRRPEGKLLGGLWEFPGGKPEPGEGLPAALRREWMEELGVAAEVGAKIGTYQHAYTHFHVTVYAFACELVSGEPAPLEHSELAWASVEELGNYPMGKVDRAISNTLQQK